MGITPIKSNFNFSANKYKDWLSVPDNSSNSSNTTNSVVPINVEDLDIFNKDNKDSDNDSIKIEDLYYELIMGFSSDSELFGNADIGQYNIPTMQEYAAFLEILKEKASKFPLNKYDLYYAIASLRQKKYGVDNYYIYYSIIDQKYGEQLSFEEKLDMAIKIGSQDKKNNYSLAHHLPVLNSGNKTYHYVINDENNETSEVQFEYNGEYYQFFNEYGVSVTAPTKVFTVVDGEITEEDPFSRPYLGLVSKSYVNMMDETLKYSDNYKKTVMSNLDSFSLLSVHNDTHAGVTFPKQIFVDNHFEVEINMDAGYDFSISTFNHELGHVFSNSFFNPYSAKKEWLDIYDIVQEFDSSHTLLRDYAYKTPEEFLAESIAEYYNINGTGDNNIYNPNDLKAIEINYNGYETLYDYIDDLVGGQNIQNISFG